MAVKNCIPKAPRRTTTDQLLPVDIISQSKTHFLDFCQIKSCLSYNFVLNENYARKAETWVEASLGTANSSLFKP